MTLSAFISKARIRMTAEWADTNPNMHSDPEWMRQASHYKCTLRVGRKQMTTYFSQGCAHTSEPTVADVLNCLASDASCVSCVRGGQLQTVDFEDFARDLGYDEDSRKAERTYRQTIKQTEKLISLLGETAADTLLWNVERL